LGENSKGYSRSQAKEDIEITRKIRKAVVKDAFIAAEKTRQWDR
jgi:hypothetical protein